MTPKSQVNALSVLDWWIDMYATPAGESQSNKELRQARAAVAELIEALRNIVALDPATDSDSGRNEWGEAECFDKAQEIASTALARIGGAA